MSWHHVGPPGHSCQPTYVRSQNSEGRQEESWIQLNSKIFSISFVALKKKKKKITSPLFKSDLNM